MLGYPNPYQRALGEVFAECPKRVLAAIAVSTLTGGGDHLEQAQKRLVTEWHVLHLNGIVRNPVPARFRALIDPEMR